MAEVIWNVLKRNRNHLSRPFPVLFHLNLYFNKCLWTALDFLRVHAWSFIKCLWLPIWADYEPVWRCWQRLCPANGTKHNPLPQWQAVSRASEVIRLGAAINWMSPAICIRWGVVKTLSNYRVDSCVRIESQSDENWSDTSRYVKHLQLWQMLMSQGVGRGAFGGSVACS